VITVAETEATADVHWLLHDFTHVPTRERQTYLRRTSSADATKPPVALRIVLKTPNRPPDNPNHVVAEKIMGGGKTVIKWDVTRDRE
jgi:hypothetical protein